MAVHVNSEECIEFTTSDATTLSTLSRYCRELRADEARTTVECGQAAEIKSIRIFSRRGSLTERLSKEGRVSSTKRIQSPFTLR